MAPGARKTRKNRRSQPFKQVPAPTPRVEEFRTKHQAYFTDPGESLEEKASLLLSAIENVSDSEDDREQTPVPSVSINVLVEQDTQDVLMEAHEGGDVLEDTAVEQDTQDVLIEAHEGGDVLEDTAVEQDTQNVLIEAHEGGDVLKDTAVEQDTQDVLMEAHEGGDVLEDTAVEQDTQDVLIKAREGGDVLKDTAMEQDTQDVLVETHEGGDVLEDTAGELFRLQTKYRNAADEARRQEQERLNAEEDEFYLKFDRSEWLDRDRYLKSLPWRQCELLIWEWDHWISFHHVMNLRGDDGGPIDRLKSRIRKRVDDGHIPRPPTPERKEKWISKGMTNYLRRTYIDPKSPKKKKAPLVLTADDDFSEEDAYFRIYSRGRPKKKKKGPNKRSLVSEWNREVREARDMMC